MTAVKQCLPCCLRILNTNVLSKCISRPFRNLFDNSLRMSCNNRCDVFHSISTSTPCHSFFAQSGFSDKTKEYKGRKLVGFSMEQMYEVVADVKNYKSFVPFCKQSNIIHQSPGLLKAELSIGFPPVHESYVSTVTLVRPRLVRAVCTEGTLFDHLTTSWKFSPGLSSEPQSCVVDFFVSFSFRSALHSHLAHFFFNELVRQMEKAFFTEAQQRFGKPSIHTLRLNQPKASSV